MIGLVIAAIWLFVGCLMSDAIGEGGLGDQIVVTLFWPFILITMLAFFIKHLIERRQ